MAKTKITTIRPAPFSLHTNGKGFWTSLQNTGGIVIEKFTLYHTVATEAKDGYDTETVGIRLHFTHGNCAGDWNTDRDGLIYTDPLFLCEFRKYLRDNRGFSHAAAYDVNYTEQGMQGRSYVSLEGGKKFVKAAKLKDMI